MSWPTRTATSSRRGRQWDKILRRPHAVYISPYHPEKHVWVVDHNMQVIHKFTNDGKTLVQTIGTPEKEGADATHFNRPTFMDWLPDGTFFVSDGYTGTRVAKFDKDGKFLMDWGIKGNPPNETRPGYMKMPAAPALPLIRRAAACSSTTATTIACRCSTRMGSSCPTRASTPTRRAFTCFTSVPIGISGPSIAARTSC